MILPTMADTSRTSGAGGRWALTPEALDGLLALLAPDREEAGRRYEDIRRRLLRIFEWRGCPYPEELVDETMNRVAHKAAEGLELRSADPFRYVCGVAQLVFKEVLRDQRKKQDAMAEMRRNEPPPPPDPEEDDERLDCLRRCLGELSADNRELIVQYYSGDGGRRIRNRRKLAGHLGVAMNALRIRAYRLRGRLEECVLECAGAK
jgi:DNA-directed RNA polymerase specialized sigma24 family protein